MNVQECITSSTQSCLPSAQQRQSASTKGNQANLGRHVQGCVVELGRHEDNLELYSPTYFKSDGTVAPLKTGIEKINLRETLMSKGLQGSLVRQENNALTCAIVGDGYFILKGPTGFEYTRNGEMALDSAGYLVDHLTGRKLQGFIADESGESTFDRLKAIRIEHHDISKIREISISKNGIVYGDRLDGDGGGKIMLGQLALATFAQGMSTVNIPGSNGAGRIEQGFVEESPFTFEKNWPTTDSIFVTADGSLVLDNGLKLPGVRLPSSAYNMLPVATEKIKYAGNLDATWPQVTAPFNPQNPTSYNLAVTTSIYGSGDHQATDIQQYFVKSGPSQVTVHSEINGEMLPTTTTLIFDHSGLLKNLEQVTALPLAQPGSNPQSVTLDYSRMTSFAAASSISSSANGSPKGELVGLKIDSDGVILGSYNNQQVREIGRLTIG